MKTRLGLLCLLLAVPATWHGSGTRDAGPAGDALPPAVTNSLGMRLVLVRPGEFLMGSPDTDPDAAADERPLHRVRITRPFYLGAYEVTQEEYRQVMGTNPSFFSPTGPGKDRVAGLDTSHFPAEQVRWVDAVEFCRRLSRRPSERRARRVYRLPTEAEWEYACRAGSTTPFAFGKSLSSEQANFNGSYPQGGAPSGVFLARTSRVGSYAPNAWGLYDMHGNVWEWCQDWYGRTYYRQSPVNDPAGPKSGSVRVIRGGEWYGDGRDCRSAFRYADLPTGVFYVMGFRVVMTSSDELPGPPDIPQNPVRVGQAPGTGSVPLAATPALLDRGEPWPRWRGPRGDGTWKGPRLSDRWPSGGLRRLWRQAVGGGYAGIVAGGNRVYTMDYQTAPDEAERVLCFDALTGEKLWAHSYPVKYAGLSYGNGPRATPTLEGRHVYALGAVGDLHCLDAATGRVHWSKDLVRQERARVPLWGFAASPLVFEDLLIVHAGAEPDGCLLALDRRTGKEVWRSLPDPAGYATPVLAEHRGRPLLVCWTPANVRGLDPRTGKLLWTVPFEVTYGTSIATPIFADGIVLVSGYYEGTKAIRLGDSPLTPTPLPPGERGRGEGATLLWQDKRNLRGLMSAPLHRAGYGYLLDKRHGLTCFELKTGKKLWDDAGRTTPKGRNPQATLVWAGAGDRALILNSEGDLILARLSPTGCVELARANIVGPTWAHPAYVGGCVCARSDSELVCVELPVADR